MRNRTIQGTLGLENQEIVRLPNDDVILPNDDAILRNDDAISRNDDAI